MKIVVDKRTEFIGIVLMLSKYNQKYEFLKNTYSNEEYINDIIRWFDKYKNDEFIILTNSAEDDENYYSGNYICSKRLKENIDYIPWNNKNLHLRDYYSKCKGSK